MQQVNAGLRIRPASLDETVHPPALRAGRLAAAFLQRQSLHRLSITICTKACRHHLVTQMTAPRLCGCSTPTSLGSLKVRVPSPAGQPEARCDARGPRGFDTRCGMLPPLVHAVVQTADGAQLGTAAVAANW